MPDAYAFPVELRKITAEPESLVIPNRLAVVRTDTMRTIGVVSRKYALLPHADVVGTLRDTFKGRDIQEDIVMTHDGARMHIEITLPDVTLEVHGDEIAMRLIVANSYDGSHKVQIVFGAYRLVCSNGMIIGRKYLSLSRRHVGEVGLDVADMRKQVTDLTGLFKISAPKMRKMASQPLAAPKHFFDPKTLHIPAYLVKIARTQFTQAEDATVWDAYNALTFAITHKLKTNNPSLAMSLGRHAWDAATRAL